MVPCRPDSCLDAISWTTFGKPGSTKSQGPSKWMDMVLQNWGSIIVYLIQVIEQWRFNNWGFNDFASDVQENEENEALKHHDH